MAFVPGISAGGGISAGPIGNVGPSRAEGGAIGFQTGPFKGATAEDNFLILGIAAFFLIMVGLLLWLALR